MKERKRKTLRVDGVYDIECARWNRFVLGVTYHRTQGIRIHRSIGDMVVRMMHLGGTWWSHNGGKYDDLAVAEFLRKADVDCQFSMSGSRISRVVGAGMTLCDSYGIVPLGLDAACEIAGRGAVGLGWPCVCGRACGGYCSITLSLTEAQRAELAAYCVEDCVTTMEMLDALCVFAADHDYDLAGTIGGAAWRTAQRWLDLPDADFPANTWRRLRSAYYGGRVSVFKPTANHGRHWDVSCAYPAALAHTPLPVGECSEHGASTARLCLAHRKPGVYACSVTVPEMHAPPLPWRHAGGVAYPVGRVNGVWTLRELDEAERRGCTISDVHWCVAWPSEELVFGAFMEDTSAVRLEVGKDSAFGAWMRLFANSLTGKLAEQPNRWMVALHPDRVKLCVGQPPCSRRRCTGGCEADRQLDEWGELWLRRFYRQSSSSHVHWAAYLTAAARGALLTGIESQGMGAAYCDTDSVWTTSRARPHPTGDAIGEWTLKHTWADWQCLAPKCYSFVNGETGEVHVRASGARLSWHEWTAGEASQDRGVMTLVEAAGASKGLFRRAHHAWTLPTVGEHTGWYGDRRIDTVTGVTHAVTCGEIQQKNRERGTHAREPLPQETT